MKLARVYIGAFGGMRDCSLAGLGDGLTVVLGPNEAGKSTYATLVRQVLYGFPDKRSKDYGFVPSSEVRNGRLIFADGPGEWSIERVDGPRRGSVTVTTVRGAERPHLLDEIVGSVSEQTYRVVFGFGLDELKDVSANDDDAVVGRLYAGVHGLRVNLIDVRKDLDTAGAQLFKPRGKAIVNDALAELKAQRTVVRELEAQARRFGAEQQERLRIEERLTPLRTRRTELEQRVRVLERDLAQARAVDQGAHDLQSRAEVVERELQQALASRDRIVVNEAVLAVEPEISGLLADESAMKQRMQHAASLDSRAAELERSAAALDVPEDASDSAEARAKLEDWRERRARLQAELDTSERAAQSARAHAEGLSAESGRQEDSQARSMTQPVLGGVLLAAGISSAAAGVVLSQPLGAALGLVVAVIGLVLLIVGLRRTGSGESLSAEAARLAAQASASAQIAADARKALETEGQAWEQYLRGLKLDARGAEPAAVLALLDDARKRDDLSQQAAANRAESERETEAAQAWAAQLSALVAPVLGLSAEQASGDAKSLAIRARDGIEQARAARDEREEAARQVDTLTSEKTDIAKKLKAAEGQLATLATHHHAVGDVVAALEANIAQVETDLELAREEYEELAREHTALVTRLDEQGRDDSMAKARQRIEGLSAQAASEADRYLVEAVALRLLDSARERFERDRQPEVLRTAGRVLSAMTDGRYVDVRAPLGGAEITVVTPRSEGRPVENLSRGTAEQLYLALRVGLIESFGAQGPYLPVLMDDIGVNFDEERRAGAAAAVAELASHRQVVFFTCHAEMAETLFAAVESAALVRLDRCSL